MTPPEPVGDLAAVILAHHWNHPGEPMTDIVYAEARRHHAAVCRDFNPDATQAEIDRFWDGIGAAGQEGYLQTARRELEETAR